MPTAMSDKLLEESSWKAFAKGRTLKDGPMLKALAAFKKADEADLAACGDAIDDIEKEAQALQKTLKADKDALKHLEDMLKAVNTQRKALAQAQQAQNKQAASAEADAAEDSPTQLSTQLITLLKTVAADEARSLPFVLGVAGAKLAVLLAKKSVTSGHKTLLQKHLGGGGVKFVTGECRFEKGAHTFILDKSIGGLATKLVAALLEQTGKRYKVRVRGSDPADVDEAEDEAQAAPASKPQGQADQADKADKAAPGLPTAQLMAAFNKIAPQIKDAIALDPTRKVALLKPMAEFQAHIKADQGAQAQSALQVILALLKQAPANAASASAAKPAQSDALPPIWVAAKQAWNQHIDTVNAQITSVRSEMLASGDADFKRIAEIGLPALTDNHKTPVMRALFDVEAAQGPLRIKAAEKGLMAVAAFLKHIDTYPLLASLDEDAQEAFGVAMTLRSELNKGLRQLAQALQAVAAH